MNSVKKTGDNEEFCMKGEPCTKVQGSTIFLNVSCGYHCENWQKHVENSLASGGAPIVAGFYVGRQIFFCCFFCQ